MPRFLAGPVVVRAPASSANVGPGFDSLGLALALADETTVDVIPSGLDIEIAGEGESELARDERHLSVRAMRAAFDVLGGQPTGLRLRCRNVIPHARGLGSSAAAIVTGVLAARALVAGGDARNDADVLDDAAALDLAARLEGHPDNVAACLLGGLTIAWRESGVARAVSCAPDVSCEAVLFIPAQRCGTPQARGLLPATVPHADAAASAGRAALLVHALTMGPSLLLAATRDWLHTDARAVAMPDSAALIATLRSAGVPAVLSGAGPSVLAFAVGPTAAQRVADTAADVSASGLFALRTLSIDRIGATATPVPTVRRSR